MINIIGIIWVHFIADFLLQTDSMAMKKSQSIKWLVFHSLVYAIPFVVHGVIYCMVNCVAHCVIDAVTSRVTKYLYQKEERHWFFVVIGFDQALHITTLLLTYNYIVGSL